MLDRRGPVYAQGSNPPDSWTVTARGEDGGVRAVARGVSGQAIADKLAERWLENPAIGATSASVEEDR